MTLELLEWDARSYDELPLPHKRWGAAVIQRLGLTGTETVLDFGCGTGRDTRQLLDILPAGRVVAVDGSQQMLQELRARVVDDRDRVTVIHADLREPLDLGMTVDAAMSVATLHWIPDHQALFHSVSAVMRSGGRFVAEGGGAGNVEGFRRALRQVGGSGGEEIWNFATIDDTARKLAEAGFIDIDVRLIPDPARLERGEQLEAFLATVMLGVQLRELAPEQRRPFVRAVMQEMPEPVVDFVRLQLSATRR